MTTYRRPAALIAASLIAISVAGCQTQSSGNAGPVEAWPSYRASQQRGGD